MFSSDRNELPSMWVCPNCKQKFIITNQTHSCNERTVEDFLKNKSEKTRSLFNHFIREFRLLGDFDLHPARTRIAFAAKIRFGYIHRLGKDFVDVVFAFNQPFRDNLCFYRIGEVPGAKFYNHYLRIINEEDVNEEVKGFMKMALKFGHREN